MLFYHLAEHLGRYFFMTDTRYIKLLRALKNNAPFLAQARLNTFLKRREELATQYKLAKQKEDTEQIHRITNEGLEVKEYIQALA